jgi:hypothetical protein
MAKCGPEKSETDSDQRPAVSFQRMMPLAKAFVRASKRGRTLLIAES